jgi:septation ring formation regulator EzrA
MSRKPPISEGLQRCLGYLVHIAFVCVAVLFFAVPIRAQRDGVIYEKVREQEKHIDATDQTVKDNKTELQAQITDIRKVAEDAHETLDEYKFAFIAVSSCLTFVSLLGFRMSFVRGKESNG